jgi:restriction endonuclease
VTTGLALALDVAAGAAMLLIAWTIASATVVLVRRRYRRTATAGDARSGRAPSADGASARVVRGAVGAGVVLGAWLFVLALVPTAISPVASGVYVRDWWPLIAVDLLSCLAAGIVTVAAWRGAFALPAADDPAYADIARSLHAAQDARDETAIRRRRAAAARREAARHRRLSHSLEAMDEMGGEEFEQLCGDYFATLGYTVDFTPLSGDGGIDLVLTRDGELAVAQCKRTRKSVGEPVVRDLYGAMHHTGADEAFLCASSGFSPAAEAWARDKAITLIDGEELISALKRRG